MNRLDYYLRFGERLKVAAADGHLPTLRRMVQVATDRVQDLEQFVPWPALIESWRCDAEAARAALAAAEAST